MFGGTTRRLLPSLCAAALLAAAALGGCGGDDDESTAKDKQPAKQIKTFSAAGEPPEVFIERTARLLATVSEKKDCLELKDVNRHSLTRFPCPAPKSLRKSMASFEVVGSEEYGTGAVVDYKSGDVKDGAAILLFVAPDRKWGISRFGIITQPSTKTSDADNSEGYAKAVDDYLAAIRKRDCKAFAAVVFIPSESKQNVCKTTFALTEPLAKRMKDFPSAKPKYEGGNASFGFFSFETRHPDVESRTISVVATGGPAQRYLVLDVAPSPPAEELEAIRRQYQLQQKQKQKPDQPPSSPSRKAS
jgi:hypothetical protein